MISQTPVTIIGGYLGSGKTTLVNHLLRNANGRRLAIMVNEFGELPIDADLIESEGDDLISLAGGCVCCSYGNDLVMAMMEMAKMDPRPDHIVLEASGVAIPDSIAGSISLLQDYAVDGVVVLADAETVQERSTDKYVGDTVLSQFACADIVLLNKIDLLEKDAIKTARNFVTNAAPNAVIIETENGAVSPEIVLDSVDGQRSTRLHIHSAPAHEIPFQSVQLGMSEPVNPSEFAQNLLDTYPNLVRAKGFVRDKAGEMQTIQIVGKRFEITPANAKAECGMVLIGIGDINPAA